MIVTLFAIKNKKDGTYISSSDGYNFIIVLWNTHEDASRYLKGYLNVYTEKNYEIIPMKVNKS